MRGDRVDAHRADGGRGQVRSNHARLSTRCAPGGGGTARDDGRRVGRDDGRRVGTAGAPCTAGTPVAPVHVDLSSSSTSVVASRARGWGSVASSDVTPRSSPGPRAPSRRASRETDLHDAHRWTTRRRRCGAFAPSIATADQRRAHATAPPRRSSSARRRQAPRRPRPRPRRAGRRPTAVHRRRCARIRRPPRGRRRRTGEPGGGRSACADATAAAACTSAGSRGPCRRRRRPRAAGSRRRTRAARTLPTRARRGCGSSRRRRTARCRGR